MAVTFNKQDNFDVLYKINVMEPFLYKNILDNYYKQANRNV